MSEVWAFRDIILAAVLGGGACSMIGLYLTNLRAPFLGVCLSHAALAGAIFGSLAGLPALPVAYVSAIVVSILVGNVAERARVDLNISMGILFSLMMGLAFVGIALSPGPRTEALGMIWGSLLFVSPEDILFMGVAFGATLVFSILFAKELKAVLFGRELARASGIREGLVYYLLLLVAGGVVTVNLEAIGGLMLYSLLVTPAATASKLTERFAAAFVLTAVVGIVASLLGLYFSYLLNAPAGASIVVVVSVLFALASAWSALRARSK